jgi:hypothetical protein
MNFSQRAIHAELLGGWFHREWTDANARVSYRMIASELLVSGTR